MNFHRLMTSAFLATWLAASLRLSGPVLLAALGETFAERSGVLNVGIEGTILLGALALMLTVKIGALWHDLGISVGSATQAQTSPSPEIGRAHV